MERKLAERLAAKAVARELAGASPDEISEEISKEISKKDIEKDPDSGVRAPSFPVRGEDDSPLTYQVYSFAQLEARQARVPVAPPAPPIPSRWPVVGRLALQVLRAAWDCYRFPKPRPRLVDMCRVPVSDFLKELESALREAPWKKIALATGFASVAFVFLLGAVLVTADFTDDLKPAVRHAPAAASEAPPTLELPASDVVELDEPPPPPFKSPPSKRR